MNLDERIKAFDKLGRFLRMYLEYPSGQKNDIFIANSFSSDKHFLSLFEKTEKIVEEAYIFNPWFTKKNIHYAFSEIAANLTTDVLTKWLSVYPSNRLHPITTLRVGVIMAGNLPLVGFHDFLSVLITGHKFIGKLSSKDEKLLPFIHSLLCDIHKSFVEMAEFEEEKLKEIDAVIATGSNNTYRYFEYYFNKYPHIFRKNRNGVALLRGDESPEQLSALADDIFIYFGLGCRNVSKIFVPENYQFTPFFQILEKYAYLAEHNKYMNNYTYYKSIYLLNRIPHLDNGFLILKQDEGYHSPIGVLYYEFYSSGETLIRKLITDMAHIQCIAGSEWSGLETIPFGKTQNPNLWDYADHIDTIDFLINLVKN